jgi:phage gp46-like protein
MLKIAYSDAGFDLVNENGLQSDDGLQTAVILSLFTDARASADELAAAGLPVDQNRGSWQDDYPETEGDVFGSKLWLLARAKRTDETLSRARGYAEAALAWLLADGVAQRVTVGTSWYGRTGFLVVTVDIERARTPRWRTVWDAISGELLEAA